MNKKQIIFGGALGLTISMVLLMGSLLLSTGILLGLFTLAGFTILYNRFPFLKKLAMKYPGFFDIGAAVLTYMLFGTTVSGLIAAAIVGIGTSFLLDVQLSGYKLEQEERFARFAHCVA